MAKRFIDTNIWNKSWYRKLDSKDKLLWIYILTKCDHAGILDGDWEAASFFMGCNISEYEELPEPIKLKMVPIDDDQYFIPSFVEYQYGVLRINSKPHLSVIKRLEEKGLTDYLQRVMVTPKDKDKDQEIDKRKDKFIEKVNELIKTKKYSNDETSRFVEYWTEMNNSETKMRFELQQTFQINRRLSQWVKNNRDWNINNKKDTNERKKMQFTAS